MAKINFKSIEFKDLAGVSFTKEEDGKIVPVTLADVVKSSLLAEDREATPTKKYDLFKLADKISQGEVNFSLDELKTITDKTGANPNPLIVGRVREVVDFCINQLEAVPAAK
jgi:hypothetical protein